MYGIKKSKPKKDFNIKLFTVYKLNILIIQEKDLAGFIDLVSSDHTYL